MLKNNVLCFRSAAGWSEAMQRLTGVFRIGVGGNPQTGDLLDATSSSGVIFAKHYAEFTTTA